MFEVSVPLSSRPAANEDGETNQREIVKEVIYKHFGGAHDGIGAGLTDIKECKMEHDHKTQRMLETLKHKEYYYVLVK